MKFKLDESVWKSKIKSIKTRDKVLFHKYLVETATIEGDFKVLDLGCGHGNTLLYISEKLSPKGKVIGVDVNVSLLAVAEKLLITKISEGVVELVVGDLSGPLLLSENSFDRIICHNVLECLTDKISFTNRCYDLLKKGGVVVMSHSDWDSQLYNSSYPELSRKLIHNYSDTTQEWMSESDGTLGRKLSGIFKKTKFKKYLPKVYTMVNDTFSQKDYGYRIAQDIIKIAKESGSFTDKELKIWVSDLKEKSKNFDYYYSSNINLVIATK